MSTPIDAVGDLLIESVGEAFASRGEQIRDMVRCAPVSDWLDPLSVIGFGGDFIRGTVSLEVPWRVLQATHPHRSTSTEELADWVGELANLSVGLLKRKLRARAVSVQAGLPMTFMTRPAQSAGMTASKLQYRLRAAEGVVLVRFTAEVTPDFALRSPHVTEAHDGIELF